MVTMMKTASSELAIILIGIRNKRFVDGFAIAHVSPEDIFGQKFGAMRHTQYPFYEADHKRSGGVDTDYDGERQDDEEDGKE